MRQLAIPGTVASVVLICVKISHGIISAPQNRGEQIVDRRSGGGIGRDPGGILRRLELRLILLELGREHIRFLGQAFQATEDVGAQHGQLVGPGVGEGSQIIHVGDGAGTQASLAAISSAR